MIDVMKYFGYENAAQFRKEWQQLTDKDKEDLKSGLSGARSLTY